MPWDRAFPSHRRKPHVFVGFLVVASLSFPSSLAARAAEDLEQDLTARGRPPVEYVLSKFKDHRVVILGEHHWVRHDVNLVRDLVPRLIPSGVTALAMETVPAAEQGSIDRIVLARRWNPRAAMAVMRASSWPYREYLEILHEVWKANRDRAPGAQRLSLIALGPGSDWREKLLPAGKTYDAFMAQAILDWVKEPGRRVLVYSGAHHAFTRYYQPELPREERVERFMDRMGNVLWRELGEEVFLITLHRPWQCRIGRSWAKCLPVGAAVDCAAAPLRRAVGFDVTGSPFANLGIPPQFWYAMGYPSLRLGDMTDGYVWSVPIERYEGVTLIPLAQYAPRDADFEEVSRNNPFSDEPGLGKAAMEKLWSEESRRLEDFVKTSSWGDLASWRDRCGEASGQRPGGGPPRDRDGPGAVDRGLGVFEEWLAGRFGAYTCDDGPGRFRNEFVEAAYPQRRFYYVLTHARGVAPPTKNSLSLVAGVSDDGVVQPLSPASSETFRTGLRQVSTTMQARAAAAAVLILALGDPGQRRWPIGPEAIEVRRERGEWICTFAHDAAHASSVRFDPRGALSAIHTNPPPVP